MEFHTRQAEIFLKEQYLNLLFHSIDTDLLTDCSYFSGTELIFAHFPPLVREQFCNAQCRDTGGIPFSVRSQLPHHIPHTFPPPIYLSLPPRPSLSTPFPSQFSTSSTLLNSSYLLSLPPSLFCPSFTSLSLPFSVLCLSLYLLHFH